MNYSISRQNVIDTLSRVLGAVDKRSTLSVLSHVLVEFYLRGAVRFTATDLEISASAECGAEVPEAGIQVCIPAQKFKDALAAIPIDDVEIEIDDLKMSIIGDGVRYQFACLPAIDFPAGTDVEKTALITFEPRALPKFIEACSHAVDGMFLNPILGGIHFCYESDLEQFTAVATDGKRLSICGIKGLPDAELLRSGITIPLKTCRILSAVAGTIEFSVEEKARAHFISPGSSITSAVLDGDYPNFRHVLPTEHPNMITVDRKKLLEALTICGVVNDDKTKGVTLKSADTEQLTVSALGLLGSATATVYCSGDANLQVTVPSKQLLQALKSLDGDEVFLKYKDEKTPLLLYPSDYGHWDERVELICLLRVD